jgi:hypothetical protein
LSEAQSKFVLAEHRAAYARWCATIGEQQSHAIFVNGPEKLANRAVRPEQFVFVDGWEKNKRTNEIMAAYAHSTLAAK